MAKYPDTHSKYPVTPKAYPAAPKVYPGTVASYPGTASAAVTPLTILGSLAWWVRSDLGITIDTNVSGWADQSGNGVNFAQAVGSAQPTLVAGVLNGCDAVRFINPFDDNMTAAWVRVAPGTQPFYVWSVFTQISWTLNQCVLSDATATGFALRARTGSPELRMANATLVNANSAAAVGTPVRCEMQFTNSTSDYLKIISTNTTGASAGNLAGSGTMYLGSNAGGLNYAHIDLYEAFVFLGTPSAGQRAELDTYCTGRYGAGLV